jgi:hypothetical protein
MTQGITLTYLKHNKRYNHEKMGPDRLFKGETTHGRNITPTENCGKFDKIEYLGN